MTSSVLMIALLLLLVYFAKKFVSLDRFKRSMHEAKEETQKKRYKETAFMESYKDAKRLNSDPVVMFDLVKNRLAILDKANGHKELLFDDITAYTFLPDISMRGRVDGNGIHDLYKLTFKTSQVGGIYNVKIRKKVIAEFSGHRNPLFVKQDHIDYLAHFLQVTVGCAIKQNALSR